MNLQSLSSHELESLLKKKVAQERQLTVEVINLLEEMNARKLYLQRGFGSLIEYCIKELGYSESSAYRRVSAMRVAREIPQIKNAISDGRLNLVTVAKAQSVFKREARDNKPLGIEEKTSILNSLENKSTRQAEKLLLDISPLDVPREKIREITANQTHVSMVLSEELVKKLNEIKNLWSHKNPNPSYAELLEMLADFTLQKLQPKTPCNTSAAKSLNKNANTKANINNSARTNAKNFHRAHIPQVLKRKIWHKADNRCQFQDEITGRRCESLFQLQIEHIHPVAKGGSNDEVNLELLCQAHNSLRAQQQFGSEYIQRYRENH